jgi:hypothetical protein
MTSPFLYFADERLSAAELSAARLDGHLVELGDAYIPADAVETRELRAGSLRVLLGDVLAATHLTAAWIHGALSEPPSPHTVQRAVGRRIHHTKTSGIRLHYRDPAIDPADLRLIGGVWVTNAARTLADLSRVDETGHTQAARELADASPGLIDEAVAWLECHGSLPHKRAGLAMLRGLASRGPGASAQDDVTR